MDFVSHILDNKLYSDPAFNKKIPSIVKQGINTPKQLDIFNNVIREETDKIVTEWTASTQKVRLLTSDFAPNLILTFWQLELFHEASKFMLRTAIRIILGEIIYNKFRDDLVEDFRTLEIDGKDFLYWIYPNSTLICRIGFAALTMIVPYLPFGKPKKVQEARKRVTKIVMDFLRNDAENHARTTVG